MLSPIGAQTLSKWAAELSQSPADEARPTKIAIYIGPEGGLDDKEISFAIEQRFQSIRIGPRVLRTETAGATVIAAIQALLGDF
jgi:16S rRNA (uracil1498-N3)-methyltransferase